MMQLDPTLPGFSINMEILACLTPTATPIESLDADFGPVSRLRWKKRVRHWRKLGIDCGVGSQPGKPGIYVWLRTATMPVATAAVEAYMATVYGQATT